MYLFTPGPTPIPEEVARSMALPMIHHRSAQFRDIFRRMNLNLRYLFRTDQPVLTLASSGTGAVEASFMNLFSPGDKVISVNNGKFGERWVRMPEKFGLKVVELRYEWGDAPTPGEIGVALRDNPDAKAVYLVHCETSTGTHTDIKNISKVVREVSSALVCVDGISSVGGVEMRFDEWGIDLCVTSSQKGLMVPPGLAFVALSKRAAARIASSSMPRYYFDFNFALEAYEKDDTPWTPPISLIRGMDAALGMIRDEGIESRWRAHSRRADRIREAVSSFGLRLFSKYPSDAVTTIFLPENISSNQFHDILRTDYSIYFAKGQGIYSEKIFRISTIGHQTDDDIEYALRSLKSIVGRGAPLR